MSEAWWRDFFDADYLHLWGGMVTAEQTERETTGLWQLLGLQRDSRVLDAPCGWGRLSRPLAERGACVLGVDQSSVLVEHAERKRSGLPEERLRYLCHDLRHPLGESGFDAAINIFSSLGYGTEEDDLAILTTLTKAIRPGGFVLVETMHRDLAIVGFSRGNKLASRLPDGPLFWKNPNLIRFKDGSKRLGTGRDPREAAANPLHCDYTQQQSWCGCWNMQG